MRNRKHKPLDTPHPHTCEKCPRRYDPDGCEKWVDESAGFLEQDLQSGKERLVTGCFYAVVPKMMAHVVRSTCQAAESADKMRNHSENAMTAFESLPNKILVAMSNALLEEKPDGEQG